MNAIIHKFPSTPPSLSFSLSIGFHRTKFIFIIESAFYFVILRVHSCTHRASLASMSQHELRNLVRKL